MKRALLVAVVLAAAGCAPGDLSPAVGPPAECVPFTARCDGALVVACDARGAWTVVADCRDTSTICSVEPVDCGGPGICCTSIITR
jgi:hypothetical protein